MRPFVHVNCAMSADGKIAGAERKQVRISSEEDMARVRSLRKKNDAILVGVGTVISDDPRLTVKGLPYGENPVRIVLDPDGRTPDGASVLNGDAPTVIVTSSGCTRRWGDAGVIRSGKQIDLASVLDELAQMGLESLLVEGGGETIASFFRDGLVDRYSVYIGNVVIGGRTAPTPADGDGWVCAGGVKLILKDVTMLGDGVLLTYLPAEQYR